MLINADLSCCTIVAPEQYEWVASPQAGVERVMLDRRGRERGRATSIVRYAPGASFPHHFHPGGEEMLVLAGVFSAAGKDYPAGWYLRNPPGSSHRPYSHEGVVIFVKLSQMLPTESRDVRTDTCDPAAWQLQGERDVCALFEDEAEQVSLQRLKAGEKLFAEPVHSAEILVLEGSLGMGDRFYERGSWVRLPEGEYPDMLAGTRGVSFYLKTSRLAHSTPKASPCRPPVSPSLVQA